MFNFDSTGIAALDGVLGGGLVTASVVLLAGRTNIGRTTLTLQALRGLGHRCLYVTGEETPEHVDVTAKRIGAASDQVVMIAERDVSKILVHAREIRAKTIAIDTIQTMVCEDSGGRAGSPTQVKACASRFLS